MVERHVEVLVDISIRWAGTSGTIIQRYNTITSMGSAATRLCSTAVIVISGTTSIAVTFLVGTVIGLMIYQRGRQSFDGDTTLRPCGS